jgi:uncharacterized delta-60 repeat protein
MRTTDLGSTTDVAYAVVVQPDGKIVLAGHTTNSITNSDFALARYDANGNLDSSFNITGMVETDTGNNRVDGAYGLAMDTTQATDIKVVAVGYALDTTTTTLDNFALVRYHVSDGSLDTGFGVGGVGKVVTNLPGDGADVANAVAVQADGKVVAVGVSNGAGTNDFALIRYNTDGTRDSSFGTNGFVTTVYLGDDIAHAVAIDANGKIVVAGESGGHVALVRYHSSAGTGIVPGDLDASFGGGGRVTTPLGTASRANAIAIQPDGKIVVAGWDEGPINKKNIIVVRYNGDGTLDAGFGFLGVAATDYNVGNDVANGIALQGDGKIVVVGHVSDGGTKMVVARYTTGGALDTGFGASGMVLPDFGVGSDGYGVAIQSNGKIVAVGSALGTAGNDFALVRINP